MNCNSTRSDSARTPNPRVAAVPGIVTVVTLTVAFGLMALGVEWFWVAFPVGFGGVLPVATATARRRWSGNERGRRSADRRGDRDGARTELARLREAYAQGELDEAEFERRLDDLLEREERP